jgi:hypothetical protein
MSETRNEELPDGTIRHVIADWPGKPGDGAFTVIERAPK